MSGSHATVSGVRFFSMEPVGTDDVFGADPGASPVAVRNPGPEKVMKPRIFPAPGLLHVSPVVTEASASVRAPMLPFLMRGIGTALWAGRAC